MLQMKSQMMFLHCVFAVPCRLQVFMVGVLCVHGTNEFGCYSAERFRLSWEWKWKCSFRGHRDLMDPGENGLREDLFLLALVIKQRPWRQFAKLSVFFIVVGAKDFIFVIVETV